MNACRFDNDIMQSNVAMHEICMQKRHIVPVLCLWNCDIHVCLCVKPVFFCFSKTADVFFMITLTSAFENVVEFVSILRA